MFLKYHRFVPSILWMCTIYYFSSNPTDSVQLSSGSRFVFFKTLHLLFYAILFLSYRYAGLSSIKSLFFVVLYGISDEYHQSFTPGRSPKATDVLFDTLGGILGLFLGTIFKYSNSRHETLDPSNRKK